MTATKKSGHSHRLLAQGPVVERTQSGVVEVRRRAATDPADPSDPDTAARVNRDPADPETAARVTRDPGGESATEEGSSLRPEIRRRTQDVSIRVEGPEPHRPPEPPARDDFREVLADAWAEYQDGDAGDAERLFQQAGASPDPETRREAALGRALSLARIGDNARAAELLEGLVGQGYRPDETVPALVRSVLRQGDVARARELLGQVPDATVRAGLSREIQAREERARLARIRRETTGPGLVRLLEQNRDLVSRCVDPYLFVNAASRAAELGETETSVSVLQALLVCQDRDGTLRVEVLRRLLPLLPSSEAEALLERERRAPAAGAGYLARIRTLEVDLLKQRMKDLAPDAPEFRETAGRVLGLDPAQEGVRKQWAWACLNAGEDACALEQFSLLLEGNPGNREYAAGKCEALAGLGRIGEALLWLEQAPASEDPELTPLRERLTRQQGILLYESGDYLGAKPYLARARSRDPSDTDLRDLLAWTYHHTGDVQAAQRLFLEAFEEDPSEASARNVLLSFRELGEGVKATRWVRGLASAPDPVLRRVAAESSYEAGQPITAARTYSGKGTCYANCDAPWAESVPYGRWRTGDAGLSRLSEVGVPLGVRIPWKRDMQWRFTLTPAWLDSGEAPRNPYAGSYYRFIEQPGMTPRSLLRTVWVATPELVLEREGSVHWRARLGSTPLGDTAVDPLPTFQVQALRRNDWRVAVHQCSVKESLLSYAGQRDPYADRAWGRMLRTGVEGAKTLWSRAPYWVSLEAGYDYYWGERTVDNHRAGGALIAGRTGPLSVGELSLGALVMGQHFQRNTNFFTFGQGGYFSPQTHVMAGPFARFVTQPCRDAWIDAQVSLGYVYYETGEAAQYHRTGENPAALTPAARDNLGAAYAGESKSNFGLSARVQGLKLLGGRWAVGGFAGVNSTTDHVEVLAGASVRFFFRPREALCFTDDLFRSAQPCL